jgi:beta-ketodecanoyl-[acyl-carrier-protein] synthase
MTNPRSPWIVISGTGLWTPAESITNDELVDSYNAWAAKFNADHAAAVAAGQIEEKPMSSARFIEKASGIKSRHVYTRDGILDINRMRPKIDERGQDDISHQAEIAVYAARRAMEAAGKTPSDIDAVIVSCAYTQRAYPAIAIEVQNVLGIEGFGFDMLMACSAATFGLHRAYDSLMAGSASCVLAVNPELVTPQVNYCDRDSHFIFGDVSTAVIMERAETAAASARPFEVLGTKALTRFSSSIRSNFGYMSRAADTDPYGWDKLFHQAGRKVFEEVSPIAAAHIKDHLASLGIRPEEVRRFWLHQANLNMNKRVIRELMGKDLDADSAPMILDTYGNTASAGSIVAFHLYSAALHPGDIGVICSFGAGYSAGSLVVRKA